VFHPHSIGVALVVNETDRDETGIVAPSGHFYYHVGARRKGKVSLRAARDAWRSARRERAICDQVVFRRSDAMGA
jgi:hypothetical protein